MCLQGLHYIHQSPIEVHGAVNVQNCVIDSRWIVKLTGFGIRRFVSNNRDPSIEGDWTTANFQLLFHMAPEILRLEHQSGFIQSVEPFVTKAADIYGLGMVLFQVCTRLPLFYECGITVDSMSTVAI